MNTQPIELARDPDLRWSGVAMQRAAQRAHTLAAQTGTQIVVSRNGQVQQQAPKPVGAVAGGHPNGH